MTEREDEIRERLAERQWHGLGRADAEWLLGEIERLRNERDGVREEITRLAQDLDDARGTLAMRDAEAATLRDTVQRVLVLAERWRYKGEFGWGPWQEGYGPDLEGQVLDECATRLTAALGDAPEGDGEATS